MHFFTFFMLFATVFVAQSWAINWISCGGSGTLKQLTVTGCEKTPVCPIKKGTNATIVFDFMTGTDDVSSATSIVHGIIAKIPVPFPLPNPDACNTEGSGLSCPLKANTAYTYSSSIPVLTEYPSLTVTVEWELKDSAGNDVFCAKMPVKIVS